MKIGILAPLKRELSAETKGGRPRIVYNLVEGLVARTHDVTVFGTGDSRVSAKLIPVIPKALFHLPPVENDFYRHTTALFHMMELLQAHKDEFDIIHNHLYPESLPLLFSENIKIVTTIHAQMTADLGEFFSHYPKTYFSPISNRQREFYPNLNYTQTVYNGIDADAFRFSNKPGNYLLFVGRIKEGDPKGVTDAIRVAKATGIPLIIIGNVESYPFFQREIGPHLNQSIRFIGDPKSAEGNLTLDERVKIYQGALALLLPIHWEEPFGIVMIEAMSCGTPVIAYPRGAIGEVVTDGITGFVVDSEEHMAQAVKKIGQINRAACRTLVEEKFTTEKMVSGYEKVYQTMV